MSFDNPMAHIRQPVRVLSVALIPSPSENEMFYNPIEVKYDDFVEQELLNETNDLSSISLGTMNNISGKILRPSAATEGKILLPCGTSWAETRFTAIITAETVINAVPAIEVYIGYTSYRDTSLSGFIAPDTVVTINNVITISKRGNNNFAASTLDHLIPINVDTDLTDNVNNFVAAEESLRPVDLVTIAERNELTEAISISGMDEESTGDARVCLHNDGVYSDSANAVSSVYLTKIMSAYRTNLMHADEDDGHFSTGEIDNNELLQSTKASCREVSSSGALIQTLVNENQTVDGNRFTVGSLCNTFGLDMTSVQVINDLTAPEDIRNEYEGLGDSSKGSMLVRQMGPVILMLMIKSLASHARFVVKNDLNGKPYVKLGDVRTLNSHIPPSDARDNELEFQLGLAFDSILKALYVDNYLITVEATVGAGCNVHMSLDGEQYSKRAPLYCSNTISSQVSLNETQSNHIGEKLSSLLGTMRDVNNGQL